MIYFVAPKGETWELEDYLKAYGQGLAGRVGVLTWEQIVERRQLRLGTYVFLAIDQMTPTEKDLAAQCWQKLLQAGPDVVLINHPSEVLRRYDLLETCFRRKRNAFRVRRAADFLKCEKFPVFLRISDDHNAALSGLLRTRKELARAVAKSLYRGYRLRDLIVVEYCDTADETGMFRKYSAFIVGDRILPHTLMHSHDWITKSQGRVIDAGTAGEEIEFVRSDEHLIWLRETFALAKIRYGRIDYGMLGGEPQVWEINTNPCIMRTACAPQLTAEQWRLRDPVRETFFPGFQAAFEAIDSAADPNQTIRIEISPSQLRKLDAEKRLRLRVVARKTALSQTAGPILRTLRRLRRSI